MVSITSRIFDFAISLEICKTNPMKKIIRPKNTHKKDYDAPFYSKEELIKFLNIVKESESYMTYCLFRTLAFTGIRKAELMGLQWGDIDFRHNQLEIKRVLVYAEKQYITQEPKTKSSRRVISLDGQTIRVLKKWKLEQQKQLLKMGINSNSNDQLVFTMLDNTNIKPRYPNKILERVIEKYQLPFLTIHGFKHTHCSLLFAAGLPHKEIQARLGHASILTTMNIYAHVTRNSQNETAEKFADFMSM